MGLFSVTYSALDSGFLDDGIKSGNAADMELRLQNLIRSGSGPATLIDVLLTGAGEGPGWEACAVFSSDSPSGLPARSTIRVACATASNGTELMEKLTARLAAVHAATPLSQLLKVEVAGGGMGHSMMALAIAVET